ncbi:phage repressor protein CI [Sodalis sp. RH15]|uniref:phage repressor protein CI n=1 Tax=Sodalis sp. RH15 TaxID=3394330 RepID=UPI0039B37486
MRLHIDLTKGGKEVLNRVLEAYGFDTKLALCHLLDISSSSLAMRYKRDFFPADIVVRCMADTGVTLEWLATGRGKKHAEDKDDVSSLPASKLVDGELYEMNPLKIDEKFFSTPQSPVKNPSIVADGAIQYIITHDFEEVQDGRWLLKIEGKIFIRDVIRIPVNRVKVKGGEMPFECDLKDIEILARVVMTCS